MIDYRFGHSLETLREIAANEMTRHIEAATEDATLWRTFSDFMFEAAKALRERTDQVGDHWRDEAYQELRGRVEVSYSRLIGTAGGILCSGLADRFDALPDQIRTAHGKVEEQYDAFCNTYALRGEEPDKRGYEENAGSALNELAVKYLEIEAQVCKAIPTLKWFGPRADLPEVSPGDPGGAGGPISAGAGLEGASGSSDPASLSDPGTTPTPSPTDPPADPADQPNSLLEGVPEALNALSQAMQSLGAAGAGMPAPVTLPVGEFDPSDLGSMSPDEYADYLERMGSPSLAGGGVDIGGGGAAGMTAVSPMANSVPLGGSTGATVPTGALSTTSGLTAGTGGSGGMPPMYPPQTQGSNPGSGVKPAATPPAAPGSPRKRKTSDTPGVSLMGRARRVGPTKDSLTPPPSANSPQGWDTEQDNGQLLDEELWQVNEQAPEPRSKPTLRRAT